MSARTTHAPAPDCPPRTPNETPTGVTRTHLLLAFAAIYVIWGSTYLAIRIGVETIPPFTLAGLRYVIAGGALWVWARMRGCPPPTRRHWLSAAVIGGLMMLGGNGLVCWAERTVPSGVAALLVSTVPFWFVLLNWFAFARTRPSALEVAGLLLGFGGVAILIDPASLTGGQSIHLLGALAVLWAAANWTLGSLYSRQARLPASPVLATGIEMFAGGVLLMIVGPALGEWHGFDPRAVPARSWLALAYLIVLGSIVAFTAYIWLLRVSTPTRVSTYAYVNPGVAVFIGWGLGNETLSLRILAAMAAIVVAVILITHRRIPPAPTPQRQDR